jgi:hypothetical protein
MATHFQIIHGGEKKTGASHAKAQRREEHFFRVFQPTLLWRLQERVFRGLKVFSTVKIFELSTGLC